MFDELTKIAEGRYIYIYIKKEATWKSHLLIVTPYSSDMHQSSAVVEKADLSCSQLVLHRLCCAEMFEDKQTN